MPRSNLALKVYTPRWVLENTDPIRDIKPLEAIKPLRAKNPLRAINIALHHW